VLAAFLDYFLRLLGRGWRLERLIGKADSLWSLPPTVFLVSIPCEQVGVMIGP